ncbi:MAG TPA: MAPEG family protein [Acetobacteraceae bacterium]|nr:MAPEG family protein [Acetobacteraceae bacterium]
MTRERPPVLAPAIGLVVAFAVWWLLGGWLAPAASDPAQRMAVACAALLPSAAVLLAMIVVQMAARNVAGAIDPTAGRDTHFLQTNQRAITNTVEQLTLFVPSLLALAARVRPDTMRQVVALALVFALARIVFWIGYLLGARLRAPGMAVTLAVNVATLTAAAWAWLAWHAPHG